MAVTPKPLVKGVLLGVASPGDPGLYKVPPATVAVIRSLTFCNTDAVSRTISAWLVRAGGSVDVTAEIYSGRVLAPGETYVDNALRVLEAGDFISAEASAIGVVSFRADGSQVT